MREAIAHFAGHSQLRGMNASSGRVCDTGRIGLASAVADPEFDDSACIECIE
jgi:hypothetical protein